MIKVTNEDFEIKDCTANCSESALSDVVSRQDNFAVGDRVAIIRHRHGWEDGRLHGNVSQVNFRSGGAAYYTVKDDEGGEYEVNATKDLFAC